MKTVVSAVIAAGLLTSAAVAQTSQPQGGANQSPTSPTSETSRDGMRGGAMNRPTSPSGTTGSSSTGTSSMGTSPSTTQDRNPAPGNAGRSGGEGGSGR